MKNYNNVLNFKCPECGVDIYNATYYPEKCSECGYEELIIVTPIKNKEELKNES